MMAKKELDFKNPIEALTKFLGANLEDAPDINTEFPTKESIRMQIALRLLKKETGMEIFKKEADTIASVMKSKGRKSREEVVNAVKGLVWEETADQYRSFGDNLET